jgi:hypothetical protein
LIKGYDLFKKGRTWWTCTPRTAGFKLETALHCAAEFSILTGVPHGIMPIVAGVAMPDKVAITKPGRLIVPSDELLTKVRAELTSAGQPFPIKDPRIYWKL